MNKKHIDDYFEKFNNIVEHPPEEGKDKEWLDHWKTYLALAIIDDLGRDLAGEIADIIDTICICERN